MKNEIVKAEDFGLEPKTATELTQGLTVVRAERELLINEFKEVSKLEITEDNLKHFKELRLKIVKNRTQGIDKWHKTNKEFFLTGGKFIDAIKRKEIAINQDMEERLMKAEKYFENIEKERLNKLQAERIALISPYLEDTEGLQLASMDNDVWEAYFNTKKEAFLKAIEEEKRIKAEEERIEAERKAEEERIRKENEELKAKADAERKERERIEAEARAKQEELERQLKAKADAERKERERIEAERQRELSKGDAEKVADLIKDLENTSKKYNFESDKNIKMYSDVQKLIEKVIIHIKK